MAFSFLPGSPSLRQLIYVYDDLSKSSPLIPSVLKWTGKFPIYVFVSM
jgi:hypothetical protein